MRYEKDLRKIVEFYKDNPTQILCNSHIKIPVEHLEVLEKQGFINTQRVNLSGDIEINLTLDGKTYFNYVKYEDCSSALSRIVRDILMCVIGSVLTIIGEIIIRVIFG